MSNLSAFAFEGREVRFVGTPEQPEWVANDVLRVLYPDATKDSYRGFLSKVPPEWKGVKSVNTPGGNQGMTTVLEPGLYHLICRSNSPKAIAFQKWVYEEVLPTIRKTGSYGVTPTTLDALRERIANLWVESESAAATAKTAHLSALRIARLCGEALLAAKKQVKEQLGPGKWEAFRETIMHPLKGEPMPSPTATLYQRIAEGWQELEQSNVTTIRGAQIKLRKPRAGAELKPAEDYHKRPTPLPPAEQQLTFPIAPLAKEPRQPSELDAYIGTLQKAIDLADRLGGFTTDQRSAIRDQLYQHIQQEIVRGILRSCGVNPDSLPDCN